MNSSPRYRLLQVMIFSVLIGFTGSASAGLINFETVPGGSPADKLAISTQYSVSDGVTFSLSNGDTPFLELTGSSDTGDGFLNDALSSDDVEATSGWSGPGLGDYFLRIGTGGLASTPVPSLIISYSAPVSAASAQIWDIDGHSNGTEQWVVEARDSGGTVIEMATSPLGTTHGASSLDGKPWLWALGDNAGSADIFSIRVSFSGSKTSGIGLAFDNFSTDTAQTIPEPGSLAILGMGLLGMGMAGRRRK